MGPVSMRSCPMAPTSSHKFRPSSKAHVGTPSRSSTISKPHATSTSWPPAGSTNGTTTAISSLQSSISTQSTAAKRSSTRTIGCGSPESILSRSNRHWTSGCLLGLYAISWAVVWPSLPPQARSSPSVATARCTAYAQLRGTKSGSVLSLRSTGPELVGLAHHSTPTSMNPAQALTSRMPTVSPTQLPPEGPLMASEPKRSTAPPARAPVFPGAPAPQPVSAADGGLNPMLELPECSFLDTVPAVEARQGRPLLRLAGLASITVTFLAASSAPTPLYATYQKAWGFSALTTTVVFGVYALAFLSALLTVGRLSDHIGRRPVLIVGIAGQVLALVIFVDAHSVIALLAARIVQGLATGAAIGAVGAGMLDIDQVRGAVANATAPGLGTASGVLLSAFAVQWLPAPTRLIYLVLIGVLLAQAVGVSLLPETSP